MFRSVGLGALVLALALSAPASAQTPQVAECLSASEHAQIDRDEGRYRRARSELLRCAKEGCPGSVRNDCERWLADLETRLPFIVFVVRDADGADVGEAVVKVDGEVVATKLDGKPVVVDPGRHSIDVSLPGHSPLQTTIIVNAGERSRVVTLRLDKPEVSVPGQRTRAKNPEKPSALASDLAAVERVSAARSQRTVGFVVGGIGIASLAAGTAFGLLAIGQASKSECRAICYVTAPDGSPNPALTDAHAAYQRADVFAWISNISLAAGVVATGLGAYLVLTAHMSPSRAVYVSPTPLANGGALTLAGHL